MGVAAFCLLVALVCATIAAAGAEHQESSISDGCVACIYQAEGGESDSCIAGGNDPVRCGSYRITEAYWEECDEPGTGYQNCTKAIDCSQTCVRTYMEKHGSLCTRGRADQCQGYAMLHRGGPGDCRKCCSEAFHFWIEVKSCLILIIDLIICILKLIRDILRLLRLLAQAIKKLIDYWKQPWKVDLLREALELIAKAFEEFDDCLARWADKLFDQLTDWALWLLKMWLQSWLQLWQQIGSGFQQRLDWLHDALEKPEDARQQLVNQSMAERAQNQATFEADMYEMLVKQSELEDGLNQLEIDLDQFDEDNPQPVQIQIVTEENLAVEQTGDMLDKVEMILGK